MALHWSIILSVLVGMAMGQSGDDIGVRYDTNQSMEEQNNHFYCRGYYSEAVAESDPNNPYEGGDNPRGPEFQWTLAFQYPVLSWLDVDRKRILIENILTLTNDGLTGIAPLRIDEVCVGSQDQIRVTEYRESIVFRIYFRDRATALTEANYDTIAQNFARNVRIRDDNLVVRFRGRDAIRLVLTDELELGQSLHPGSTLPPDRDPTLHAVFLNSIGAYVSGEDAMRNKMQGFASNPNPINYGLESGDIVFIFFGTILLAGVASLIVLGFIIHPFFLA